MKRRKGNLLMKKLDSLNTQDYSDDISWSSSDDSDCENKSNNVSLSAVSNVYKKRKRKEKIFSNLSNLNVSIINSSNIKDQESHDKSPILFSKHHKQVLQSPVLKNQSLITHKQDIKKPHSPILNNKIQMNTPKDKSPVLVPKQQSAVFPNIIKKLFQETDRNVQKACRIDDMISKYPESSNHTSVEDTKVNLVKKYEPEVETVLNRSGDSSGESSLKTSRVMGKNVTKLDLMKNVKTYFESNFSSGSASQHSISECETVTPQNTSKSNDDFEICNSLSQTKCLRSDHHDSFLKNYEISTEKKKKIKYKKDGLAYRLNNLLKKQNCNVSLWQHEKFLASNSNFIIPTSRFTGFRVKNVTFKYNCYLVEGIDLNDDDYLLIINACYVISCVIAPDYMIKLYEPYKIIIMNNCKVIVNVCKFECVPINM